MTACKQGCLQKIFQRRATEKQKKDRKLALLNHLQEGGESSEKKAKKPKK